MAYWVNDLGSDFDGRCEQQIVGLSNGAFNGVLCGHHSMVGSSIGDFVEDFAKAYAGIQLSACAEICDGGFFAVSAVFALKRDPQPVDGLAAVIAGCPK